MRWDERDVYFTWIDGVGWVRYPVRIPILRPVTWDDTPPTERAVTDGLVTVWCGPRAHLPSRPSSHLIRYPRQVISQVPQIDLQFPQWRSFYASKIVMPDKGCAWPYEVGQPDLDGWCQVIWKVWDL